MVTVTVTDAESDVIHEVLTQAWEIHTARDTGALLLAASSILDTGDESLFARLADLFDAHGDNDYNISSTDEGRN